MKKEFDIQEYMTKAVEKLVADTVKATFKNPKQSAFMLGGNGRIACAAVSDREHHEPV